MTDNQPAVTDNEPVVVSVYTNAQAIEDGIKMDVTEQAKGYGFAIPVFMTTNLFKSHIEVKSSISAQSTEGRMHDLLFLTTIAVRGAKAAGKLDNMITVKGKFGNRVVTVWAILDGDGLTLLLPEDY